MLFGGLLIRVFMRDSIEILNRPIIETSSSNQWTEIHHLLMQIFQSNFLMVR